MERERLKQLRQKQVMAKQKHAKDDNRIVIRTLVVGAMIGAIVGGLPALGGGIERVFEGGVLFTVLGLVIGAFTGAVRVARKH